MLGQRWHNVHPTFNFFGFTALVIDPHYKLNLDLKHGNQNYAYRLIYEKKRQEKSPGSATITNRSPSKTPRGSHFDNIFVTLAESAINKLLTFAQRWPNIIQRSA